MIPTGRPPVSLPAFTPKTWVTLAVAGLCLLPLTLNLLGLNLASHSIPLSSHYYSVDEIPDDALYRALAGSMHHALLEWSAVSIAVLTALVSFIHYAVRRDPTIPIIGMAMLSAGLVDSFHTLAATRIIEANAPNTDFIPFTWAISRIFNASIMLIGVSISIWLTREQVIQHRGPHFQNGLRVIGITSLVFLGLSYAVVHIAATSTELPQTMYTNALITRPLDLLPLALFLLCGALFWSWYKQKRSAVKFGLILCIIPEVATQLHMAFGSTQLFDNHFNIAHAIKILAYCTVFFGVLIDLIIQPSFFLQTPATDSPKADRNNQGVVDIDFARQPLGIQLPIASFLLSLGVALIVGLTFYFESERLVIDQELTELEHQSQLIHPLLSDFYDVPFQDASFFSKMPAIKGIIQATKNNRPQQLKEWKRRLELTFEQVLESRKIYSQMRFIGVANDGLELVNVKRILGNVSIVPASKMQKKGHRPYFKEAIEHIEGSVYFSPIELRHDQGKIQVPHTPVMRVATPIYDPQDGTPFGIVIISTNFNAFIDSVREKALADVTFYLANSDGDFLVHPDKSKTFGFDLGQRYLMQEEFTELKPAIENATTSVSFRGKKSTVKRGQQVREQKAGYYSVIQLYQFGLPDPLRLLLQYSDKKNIQSLIELRNRSVILALALAFVVLGLSILASRRMISPLIEMTNSVQEYEKSGQLQSLPLKSRDEIGVLARSFHNLLQTQRIQEKEIQQARQYIDGITEGIPHLLAYIDSNRIFRFVNKNYEVWFERESHDFIGHHISAIFIDDYATVSPHVDAVLTGEHVEFDHILTIKPHVTRTVHITFTPDIDNMHKVQGFFSSFEDIGQRKALEQELKEAVTAAQESAELKSSFLASMSHEIRTPMNGVLGMLNLLKREQLSQKQRHYLGLAKSSADSLLILINDILDFSKIEAGKLELEYIDYDLISQLGDFVETMGHRAQDKGLELILDSTQVKHTMVKGDPGRLRQILTNLVSNAIKFTEQGEIVIRVGLEHAGESGLILYASVSDTGIGIPASKIDNLFDSFTQVDASTTRKFGGTGLGLAIVKQLTELMGGSISVHSKEGKGSSFKFSILLQESGQSLEAQPQADISGSHILVVDDNETNREVVRGQLQCWGATITTACSGPEALNLLSRYLPKTFDAAILDMQMPDMDGATLGKTIRENPLFDGMPMIMMTSIGERGDANHFSKLGFAAYFPKPATTSDLYQALGVVIGVKPHNRQDLPLITRHNVKDLSGSNYNHNLRILMVEDNRTNQAVALGMLEDLGLEADVAFNGQEAIDMLNNCPADAPYQIILMDCQMPVLDGYQTTAEIRSGAAGENYKTIPIVAMTANAMQGDKEKCLEAGMDDYMSKPISTDDLEQNIRRYTNGGFPLKASAEVTEEIIPAQPSEKANTTDDTSAIWDKPSALKRVRNREDRLHHLIQLFLDDMPDRVEEMISAANQQNFSEAAKLAHAIKGVSGNLSALKLHELSAEIETAAKAADSDTLNRLVKEAQQQFNQLIELLQNEVVTSNL
ncbi:hypothetical protein R50073_32370 [Maricurvus nonylphenolicus]|uniref:response regulator n=1 Tax=Maricurvus nonylphenolicus TaxID=1008307 RepID=UPI0036F2FE6E